MTAVYLLLGDPQDPYCLGIQSILERRNHPTRIIPNPLAHPWRFTWNLNSAKSASQLAEDGGSPLPDEHIAGVLVRNSGWINPEGWQADDLAYMQTETRAALLAWLWSLACPVVNRYPPVIWYQPRLPLLSWQRLLRRCGLPTSETLVTNVEQEARLFGGRLAREGVAGLVYGPLTSETHYLVSGDVDLNGLVTLQRYAPVCLTYPHGPVQTVCVVGELVVWEGEPPHESARLESALRSFAAVVGLDFVELAFAPAPEGFCVVDVEPYPHFEHFGEAARQRMMNGLVDLLTASVGASPKGGAYSLVESHS